MIVVGNLTGISAKKLNVTLITGVHTVEDGIMGILTAGNVLGKTANQSGSDMVAQHIESQSQIEWILQKVKKLS